MTGRGVQATVEGSVLAVGGPALLAELNLTEPEQIAAATRGWKDRGASVLHVIRDGAVIGAVALEDEIRDESRQAVQALQDRGIKVAMITGDARQVAQAVAAELHIDDAAWAQ